jgi:type II secretory pathway pseudopilin PulG
MRAMIPTTPRLKARAGFTMIEMMIAMLLTMLIFGITIPFFRMQSNALDGASARLDATQNARFAQEAIDRELRLAGGATGQPIIVQAAPFSVTFNVDLVTTQTSDPDATYYNPNADSLSVESWLPARAKALPTSSVMYPTQEYFDGNGFQSHAETISWFLYLDPTTGRNDLYTLFRRVNDRDSTVVAHNMWIPVDTNYFFQYSRTDSAGDIVLIPQASLPIYWNTAGDWADSIRLVNMRIAGLFHDNRKNVDITRTLYQNTRLLNAGMLKELTCGSNPLPPGTTTAVQYDTGSPTYSIAPAPWFVGDSLPLSYVQVTFAASPEELGGLKDISSYVVERTLNGTTNWQVLANQVAYNQSTYTYNDYTIASGTWVYGAVAVNCSPAYSTVSQASAVTNP